MLQPRFFVSAFLLLGLVFATAMTRVPDAPLQADALTAEAHALVAEMQAAARTAEADAEHPLALLDTPAAFQALTIYRDHASFRLAAGAPGVGVLTVTDVDGTERLRVRFDHARVLATDVLA